MAITHETRVHIRERAIREAKRYLVLVVYLTLFLGSFMIYRRLVLAQYQIAYYRYGYALIEALILAKVILIGEVFNLGEKFRDRPLIVPAIYKALLFSIFVLLFSAIEDLVSGLVRHEAVGGIFYNAVTTGIDEKIARTLVTFVAFIPLFAYRELGRILGTAKLYEIFFKPGSATADAGGNI